MSAPVVSVIIPSFNCQRYIAETIDSVLAQTFTNFEVIIVDDGSTDNQKDVIAAYVQRDSRVRYVYQKNSGVSAARNNGFKASQGTFIAFLDSDDVWLENNLELKVNKLQDDEFGLVHSDARFIDELSQPKPGTMEGEEGNLLENLLIWKGTQVPGPSSILVRRSVIESIGGFDIDLSTSADREFFLRVAARYRIGRVPVVTWHYRVHPQNMHKNIALLEHDSLLMFKKATSMKMFKDAGFRRQCYAVMYTILGASWAGDGKNKLKGMYFLIRSLGWHPPILIYILQRVKRKWLAH
jgi:glycosyltransferase involved in cell wall biosynthesis